MQTGYFRRNVYIFQTTFAKIVNKSFFFDFCWVIVKLRKTVTDARCIVLESANILKIAIFHSRVKFPILQNFRTVSIFWYDFWNSFYFQVFCWKNNELWEIPLCFFKINIFHFTDYHIYPFLYTNTGYLKLFFIQL